MLTPTKPSSWLALPNLPAATQQNQLPEGLMVNKTPKRKRKMKTRASKTTKLRD